MTTLDVSFLRAITLLVNFRGDAMRSTQAALLLIAMRKGTVSGADIPREISGDSIHVCGAACGSLLALNLLEACGRIKSPHENAKGRKLNLYRIPEGRLGAAKAWLGANGYEEPATDQLCLAM